MYFLLGFQDRTNRGVNTDFVSFNYHRQLVNENLRKICGLAENTSLKNKEAK